MGALPVSTLCVAGISRVFRRSHEVVLARAVEATKTRNPGAITRSSRERLDSAGVCGRYPGSSGGILHGGDVRSPVLCRGIFYALGRILLGKNVLLAQSVAVGQRHEAKGFIFSWLSYRALLASRHSPGLPRYACAFRDPSPVPADKGGEAGL